MLIPKAIEILQNVTKKKITHNDVAQILGVTKQAISSRVHRKQELKQYEWDTLKEFYNFQNTVESNDLSNENISANYYSEFKIAVKDGKYEILGEKELISFPIKLIYEYKKEKKYFLVNATGDSMKPEIKNGDKLIIEACNGNAIEDNQIYIFSYKNKIFVKRLVQNVNQISVISDNQDKTIYPTQYISDIDFDKTIIIGKIAGLARKLH